MKDLQTLISGIEYKLRVLIEQKKKLEEYALGLGEEINKKDRIVLEQSQKINKLEEQIKIYKLGESINKKRSDITEVKLKINELVRRIDKCVGLIKKNEQY